MVESLKILLVEDDAFVRLILTESLQDSGFAVTTDSDGKEAIERLQGGFQPDIVITDMRMANVQGAAVIMFAKINRPEMPVIAMSGGGMTEATDTLTLAKKAGADRIFEKPIDINALEKAILELTSPAA
ncbi:MAG: response regulator [Micavibrio sp.]|nr:response regulator [Micavibrio sp.]